MTVGEFIKELQKFDPDKVLVYPDEVTGSYFEVVGSPYQVAMVETKQGVFTKQELATYEDVEVVREFEAVSF